MSIYDFLTLYTTLPHNAIKDKRFDLIERAFKKTFKNEGTLYIACNNKKVFFSSTDHRGYKLWSCQNLFEALSCLLENIYIRFGNKLYRQTVGIPMGTNCAPFVADLILFCYKRDLMTSLSDDNQADIIEAFTCISMSRYLDDPFKIIQIYPPKLQLNKANSSDYQSPLLDFHLSISNGLFPQICMIKAIALILIS